VNAPARRSCYAVAALSAAAFAAASPSGAARSVPAPRTVTMALGSTFTANGQTGRLTGHGARAVGVVVVRGRWGDGPWSVLTTVRTDRQGRYRFSLRPHRRGVLRLRVTPPDHQMRQFVLHVV